MPFDPQTVDEILSTVQANKEILRSVTATNLALVPDDKEINLEEPISSGYPAQPGLTWRNPVRVASPHRIKSFLCESVSPLFCEG